jgi:D-arabinose 1-dehydrogenase-like Zn-dependent alcohol dehydrogenase
MRAAVVEKFNQPYTFRDVPRPAHPTRHDLLVKVLAASYCHTDAVFASGAMSQDLPRVGCHEFAGRVVAVGDDVPVSLGMRVGAMVGVPGRAYRPCGVCWECRHPQKDPRGYSPYCPAAGNLGLTRDGGFQEFCLVDSRQVAPLPDSLAPTQAAPLMCAGLTVWAALHHERVRGAQRVAILGAGGGLGHIGVQFAAHLGKEVLAVDANDTALELLRDIKTNLGAVGEKIHIADARHDKASSLRAEGQDAGRLTPPSEVGMDAVVLLPETQKAFDMGMELLRNHGTMVVVSFPKEKLAVSAADLVFRDINVVGSLVGRNHQLRDMVDFVVAKKVEVKVKTFAFEQLNSLVERSKSGASGKLVIDMLDS